MDYLASSGIPVVPLDRAAREPGSVAITFDDGFGNVADHALAVLEKYRLPATIFVVSDFCGGRNNWPSQPSGSVPELPLMGWGDLRSLPEGITVGAHTATHPDLTQLSDEACEREMTVSKNETEQRTAKRVRWLAYPYGATSTRVRDLAARHFDLAAGTKLRFLPPSPDRADLPRIDTFYLRGTFPLERLFTFAGDAYIGFRHLLREARRAVPG
jgi:peptidoglycan/xylan/chitin deacetylase (PgdA/CDA1 family)